MSRQTVINIVSIVVVVAAGPGVWCLQASGESPNARGPTLPDAPLPESPPIRKPRYISFSPGNPGRQIALRITLADIKLASQVNGQVRWTAAPQLYNDGILPQFWAAQDQCTPHYQDWSSIPLLHAYGRDLAAGSLFAVQAIEQGMDENIEANYSPPFLLTTSDQGDTVGIWNGTIWTPPDGVVTYHDMLAGIACFQGALGRITKVRCQQGYPEPNPAASPNFGEMVGVASTFMGVDAVRSPLNCGQSPRFACGNGVQEPGETCDDNNTDTGDGCDERCLLEPTCGNDRLDPGERCDDANGSAGDGCSDLCLIEDICGNGAIEPEFEECDDGGTIPGDGCDALCRAEARTAFIKVTPVQPMGTSPEPYPPGTQITGQEIRVVDSGVNVWLDFTVSDWDIDDDGTPKLAAIQFQLAEDVFESPEGGLIRLAQVPCVNSVPCTAAIGQDSQCQVAANRCVVGFFTASRPDSLQSVHLFVPDLFPPTYRFGLATLGPLFEDRGIDHYAGTLVLGVPPGAAGTFNLGLAPELTSTFLADAHFAAGADCGLESTVIRVDLRKNRYLTIGAPLDYGVGEPLAARIELVSLPQFSSFNGQVRWSGAVASFSEGPSGGSFDAAALQCDPFLQDLSGYGEIHVHGEAIVPGSTYEVRFATAACVALGVESCMSNPITLPTSKWGDSWLPFDAGQPNFVDIATEVNEFQDNPGAVSKSRTQLYGDDVTPGNNVNFLDISACVGAFMGQPYPHSGPTACP